MQSYLNKCIKCIQSEVNKTDVSVESSCEDVGCLRTERTFSTTGEEQWSKSTHCQTDIQHNQAASRLARIFCKFASLPEHENKNRSTNTDFLWDKRAGLAARTVQ